MEGVELVHELFDVSQAVFDRVPRHPALVEVLVERIGGAE